MLRLEFRVQYAIVIAVSLNAVNYATIPHKGQNTLAILLYQ